MYTVCWTVYDGTTVVDHWERCESREEVVALLKKNRLIDDGEVLIFGPEAEDYLLDPWEVIG